MGLLSFFKRKTEASPIAAGGNRSNNDPADEVMRARIRARQRLIGAAVLVVVGIIGFPLVFETQPRPIPVDIPIEIPRKEGAPPLAMPPAMGLIDLDNPRNWGRSVARSANGRQETFELDFGSGNKVVTEVFWADPDSDAHVH